MLHRSIRVSNPVSCGGPHLGRAVVPRPASSSPPTGNTPRGTTHSLFRHSARSLLPVRTLHLLLPLISLNQLYTSKGRCQCATKTNGFTKDVTQILELTTLVLKNLIGTIRRWWCIWSYCDRSRAGESEQKPSPTPQFIKC